METKYKRILIISLAGIGDLIMATPTIKAIRKEYPKAQIDFLTFPKGTKDVLEGGKIIDKFYLYYDRKNTISKEKPSLMKTIKNSFFLILKLRLKRYDLSVSVFPSASNSLGLLAKLIGAKKRIGFESKYYTDPIEWNYKDHKVEQNLRLLKPLGIEARDKEQFFYISNKEINFAKKFLKNHIKTKGPIIGIHPGCWWKASLKKWPIENYVNLVNMLIKKYNTHILVICGPSEEEDGRRLKEMIREKEKVTIIEKQNLKNTAAIIERCNLFISSDSGIMHIAEAMNVPIIMIPGYTLFKFSGVYKKENIKNIVWERTKCYEKCPVMWKFAEEFAGREDKIPCNIECYKNITPKMVLKTVDKNIKKLNLVSY